MKYVGIETQQRRNNTKSLLLLSLFPLILAGATYLFCLFVSFCVLSNNGYVSDMNYHFETRVHTEEGTSTTMIGDWGGPYQWQKTY